VRQYLVDEDRQLVARAEMQALAGAIASLEAVVGRLEAKLASPQPAG
jgi:ubiquinone biosynthesis protein UbiJ